jgi:hypothetical protein
MPISVEELAAAIRPERTVLLFGSGSSIPSGAPSVGDIRTHLAKEFNLDAGDLTLAELAAIIEKRRNRSDLVASLRKLFARLRPTGGLLSIPLFAWRSIYTTNYDTLIEQSFSRARVPISVYASNFDFKVHDVPQALRLMKLHGTIDQDIADGHRSRLIITEADYDLAEEFREYLFDSLKADMAGTNLIIVGHSLADQDIREIVNRAVAISQKAANAGTIYLFAYRATPERAELYEGRGLKVCFGGIDDFSAALTKRGPMAVVVHAETGDPIDASPLLSPLVLDVQHALAAPANVSAMFNGWPASYGDVVAGNTFARSVVGSMEQQLLAGECFGAILLGAGGVGKTTAARQLLHRLTQKNFRGWEHKGDHRLLSEDWVRVAEYLERKGDDGVLFVDDADSHLFEVNALFDQLAGKNFGRLRVVLAAARNHWNPRVKSPNLFSKGKTYVLERLGASEITDLLRLVEVNGQVAALVDASFMGFSVGERRRRLEDRCERDMFVCLKNIFASEKFDDIILREYASLAAEYRDIYKHVAALESSGVRVHRQLMIRLLGIPMTTIPSVLEHLTDIVHEYTVDERDGIYAWRGRHSVIMGIIADYKFAESESFATLFERVVDAINPTFDIEVRTLRELCGIPTGIRRIADLRVQNRILAKMISVAPGERVPRHRLIRNLIEVSQFEQAESEIRLFSKDFREDGPVHRYRVRLAMERARGALGLLEEDRLVILERARELAVTGVRKFPGYKNMLFVYADVGIEIFKRTKKLDAFDDAMKEMRAAEQIVGDPDITRQIAYYERRVTGST